MKTIEKYMGVKQEDFQTLMPSIQAASSRMVKDYTQRTHPKLKMLDALILLSIATFIIQLVYAQVMVFSKDPFNSYLAGLFCSLGQFALSGKYLLC